MPRIRTIKPEYWTSEQVVELSLEARLAFIGLWNFADDWGRHPASARSLKLRVFPGDNIDAEALVEELVANGLVFEYEADRGRFWQVLGWFRNQRIDRRGAPRHPHPDPATVTRSTCGDDLGQFFAELAQARGIAPAPIRRGRSEGSTSTPRGLDEDAASKQGARREDSPQEKEEREETETETETEREQNREETENKPLIFPLKGGATYTLSADDVDQLRSRYPRRDVDAKLAEARAWCWHEADNPHTEKSLFAMFNRWLEKAPTSSNGKPASAASLMRAKP